MIWSYSKHLELYIKCTATIYTCSVIHITKYAEKKCFETANFAPFRISDIMSHDSFAQDIRYYLAIKKEWVSLGFACWKVSITSPWIHNGDACEVRNILRSSWQLNFSFLALFSCVLYCLQGLFVFILVDYLTIQYHNSSSIYVWHIDKLLCKLKLITNLCLEIIINEASNRF